MFQAIIHCISACYSVILWELRQLKNGSGRGTSAGQQQKQLRDHLNDYISLMTLLIIASDDHLVREEVRHIIVVISYISVNFSFFQAFMSACEFLSDFSEKLASDNPLLRPLVYQPDGDLQQILKEFGDNAARIPAITLGNPNNPTGPHNLAFLGGVPKLRKRNAKRETRNAKRLKCETAVRNGPKSWDPVSHFRRELFSNYLKTFFLLALDVLLLQNLLYLF
jgi:cohesin complex subunit SA-1/2